MEEQVLETWGKKRGEAERDEHRDSSVDKENQQPISFFYMIYLSSQLLEPIKRKLGVQFRKGKLSIQIDRGDPVRPVGR